MGHEILNPKLFGLSGMMKLGFQNLNLTTSYLNFHMSTSHSLIFRIFGEKKVKKMLKMKEKGRVFLKREECREKEKMHTVDNHGGILLSIKLRNIFS